MSNNLVFTNLLYFLTKTSILYILQNLFCVNCYQTNFQTTLRYTHADIENKKVSANVIENKLALDTKDTKKEQITKLTI